MISTLGQVQLKVSCDLCGIPIFLYPGDYPGTCKDCEEKLKREGEIDVCYSCGRLGADRCRCDYCRDYVCELCKTDEHLTECDSDWDDD